jgi:integrase
VAKVKIGSIRSRRDRPGCYECDYYVNGQRRRALAESREAVSSKVAELIKDAENEPEMVSMWDPDIGLNDYATHWLDNVVIESVEPRTVEAYRQMLEGHVLPFKIDGRPLGNMKLRELRRRHIKALLIDKRKQGYSKDTVRHFRAALSSLLTDAVEDEIIDLNPALQVSNRKKKIADKKNQSEFEANITPMSAKEFEAFSMAAQDPKEREFGPFYIFLGKTGCRPSEAIAILPSDIDEKKRKVQINKVCVLNSGKIRPYTKNGVARRVDLSPELFQLLKRHQAYQNENLARRREEAFKKGNPIPKKPEMLFPNRSGNYIDWNNAVDAFHRICEKAQIGRFRPYALRHTFATILLAEGAPITYVASQLGHSKPTTTLRYYAKWLPDQGDRFIELLDSAGKKTVSETIMEAV